MRSIVSLLRSALLTAITATVLLLVLRYLLDLPPELHADLQTLAVWVRKFSEPLLVPVGTLIGMQPGTGPMNPLPVGLAIATLLAGGFVVSLLNRADAIVSRPRSPRATPAPQTAESSAPAPAPAPSATAPPAPAAAAAPVAATAWRSAAPGAAVDSTASTMLVTGARPQGPAPGGIARPTRIGRYEIVDELGRGAMGVVYKARDPQIGRLVAIKTVLGGVMGDSAAEDFKRRFFAEARAAGRLNHPGIMKVHDLVEDDAGHPCLVLEFFEGRTLDRLVADTKPSLALSIKIMTQAAQGLAFAHDNGVVHRDIKPGNIMVAASGHTVIADFGIAKMDDVNLTATGTIMGTPAYMSPEQVQGLPVDKRSDIFSLGTVLYWMLTGERPFPGSTFTSIAYNVVHTNPRPARELTEVLPPGIEPILDRCLAKAPMDRYASAHEMAADLKKVPGA